MLAAQKEGLAFLEGLVESFPESVLVELLPGKKHTRRPWDYFEKLHWERGRSRFDLAERWFRRGSGVGVLPRGGLWCLDLDSPVAERQATEILIDGGWFPPRDRTPSLGLHLWMKLPPGVSTKNHVGHPKNADGETYEADFIFGPRSHAVGAGTIRDGRCYSPESDWLSPPVVHPNVFLPEIKLERDHKPFLTHQGTSKARAMAACAYLRYVGVSIEHSRGGNQLHRVAGNLVGWFGADPGLAFYWLTHPGHGVASWNDRCKPPWSDAELRRACEEALDNAPELGIQALERLTLKGRIQDFLAVVLQTAMVPGSWCLADDLRRLCEHLIGKTISPKLFGGLLHSTGIPGRQRLATHQMTAEGVDLHRIPRTPIPCHDPIEESYGSQRT